MCCAYAETSTALVSDYRCGAGLFMCLEKDATISMTMEGGDPMGHCDDVRMDARNRGVCNCKKYSEH